ncbi:MAG: DUF5715 family protein [Gemmatimonadota bacterium]
MRQFLLGALALSSVVASPAYADVPVTLEGSPASMVRQHEIARAVPYPFAETPGDLGALERTGELVRLEGNADYELADFVRHSQARAEVRIFVERLSAQYRAATGEKLVVTSLSRPASDQPGNSHDLSVHPAGIAIDLRVSRQAESRRWLEDTLLSLERRGVLDVTRESNPPHYHVALFPGAYMAHAERLDAERAARGEAAGAHRSDSPHSARDRGRAADAGGAPVPAWIVIVLLPVALGAALRRRGSR